MASLLQWFNQVLDLSRLMSISSRIHQGHVSPGVRELGGGVHFRTFLVGGLPLSGALVLKVSRFKGELKPNHIRWLNCIKAISDQSIELVPPMVAWSLVDGVAYAMPYFPEVVCPRSIGNQLVSSLEKLGRQKLYLDDLPQVRSWKDYGPFIIDWSDLKSTHDLHQVR